MQKYTKISKSQGYILGLFILKNFATEHCNFTIFRMLFQGVEMDGCSYISKFSKFWVKG